MIVRSFLKIRINSSYRAFFNYSMEDCHEEKFANLFGHIPCDREQCD
jgi:hypothetical protein